MLNWTSIIYIMISISPALGGSSGITSGVYQKSTLPTYAANCTLTTHEVSDSQYIKNYKTITCSTFCTKDPKCKAFCIIGNSCILLDILVSSGGTSPPGGMAGLCYVPVRTEGPSGEDLVRGKGVQPQNSYSSSYAAVDTVVSGGICLPQIPECFCSIYMSYPGVVVDLGSTQPIASLVVTASPTYPGYFDYIEARVGSEGSRNDDLLAEYSDPNTAAGARIILKGSKTFNGRYVSIFRKVTSSDYKPGICLCLLEAYSHL